MIRLALPLVLLLACRASDGASAGGAEPDPGEVQAAGARAALVGSLAPEASAELLGGGRVDLQTLIGHKPVYLKFWATWCVPCREQMPHLEAAHEKYGDRMAIVAVNLGLNDWWRPSASSRPRTSSRCRSPSTTGAWPSSSTSP